MRIYFSPTLPLSICIIALEIVQLNNIIAQQKRKIHYTLQTMNNVLDSKGAYTQENSNDEVYRLLLTYKGIKCDEITNLEQERIKKNQDIDQLSKKIDDINVEYKTQKNELKILEEQIESSYVLVPRIYAWKYY